jgi:hypothetical protein
MIGAGEWAIRPDHGGSYAGRRDMARDLCLPRITSVQVRRMVVLVEEAAETVSSVHDRVHAGHPDAAGHDGDPGVGEDGVEQRRVLGVPVPDEELDAAACVLQVHDQVAGGMGDPGGGRVGGRAQDPDPSARRVRSRRGWTSGVPVNVTVSMKSVASSAWAWVRRKSTHVVEDRSGAGSMPA